MNLFENSFSDLVERYARAAREATAALGEFTLFGLFERDDSPGRVDILAASPWLTADRDGIVQVARFLPRLKPGESAMIGSLVPLLPEDAFVRAAMRLLPDVSAGEVYEMGNALLGDVQIARAYVLAAHKADRVDARSEPLAA